MNTEILEYTLNELVPGGDKILAYLNPKLIWNYEYENGSVGYYLQANVFQVSDILQSWIYQDETLKECSAEQYIQYRAVTASEGIDLVEFSIVVQEDIARVVWRWENGRVPGSSRGGTYILQNVNNQWIEMQDLGEFWRT